MRYNYKDLRRRINEIEGGYATLAKAMGVSYQRIMTIMSGKTSPKESTMARLNKELSQLEKDRDEARREYADIFLP